MRASLLPILLAGKFRGFPLAGLQNLYMFEDGSGTAPASSAGGNRGSGSFGGAGSTVWLTGGGGLQLVGVRYLNAPAIDFTTPWTLAACGRIDIATPGVIAPAEGIVGVLGFSNFGVAPIRGAALYARKSPTPWSTSTGLNVRSRPTVNGAARGTETSVLPDGALTPDDGVVFVLSFDGVATMTSKIVNKNGSVICSVDDTIDPVAATTASSVQLKMLPPSIGAFSSTYGSGSTSIEAFAVYSKVLGSTEINAIAAAGAALGAARGRAW
jgi:hypothetical protein